VTSPAPAPDGPTKLPGYWQMVGFNPRERAAFSMKRADGPTIEIGFRTPTRDLAKGQFPPSGPTDPIGFYLVVPKDVGAEIAGNTTFTIVAEAVCSCPPGGDEDPDCARHGTEAIEAVKATRDVPDIDSPIFDEGGGAGPAMSAFIPAAKIKWTDSTERVHIVAQTPIEAARKADALLPPPEWIRVPEGWPWPVQDRS